VSKANKSFAAQVKITEGLNSTASAGLAQHSGHDMDNGGKIMPPLNYNECESIFVGAPVDLVGLDLMALFDSSTTDLPLVTTFDMPREIQNPAGTSSALELFLLDYCKLKYILWCYRPLTVPPVANGIASELVAIDDQRNGWRHLVLPIAHCDRLIMDSALAAAAFHFTRNVSKDLVCPITIYQSAIAELRHRQDIRSYSNQDQQIIMLSLLTLLATTMVNGSVDFRVILQLIEAAWDTAGGEASLGTGELGVFVTRQYRK
jgi:hypothetical protein